MLLLFSDWRLVHACCRSSVQEDRIVQAAIQNEQARQRDLEAGTSTLPDPDNRVRVVTKHDAIAVNEPALF